MNRGARALIALLLVCVPAALFWYGVTRCQELSCIGPMAGIVLDALVVLPLLLIWLRKRSPVPLCMLVFAEAAMAVSTFRRDFDFSPQFRLLLVPIGLAVGAAVGLAIRSATARGET